MGVVILIWYGGVVEWLAKWMVLWQLIYKIGFGTHRHSLRRETRLTSLSDEGQMLDSLHFVFLWAFYLFKLSMGLRRMIAWISTLQCLNCPQLSSKTGLIVSTRHSFQVLCYLTARSVCCLTCVGPVDEPSFETHLKGWIRNQSIPLLISTVARSSVVSWWCMSMLLPLKTGY